MTKLCKKCGHDDIKGLKHCCKLWCRCNKFEPDDLDSPNMDVEKELEKPQKGEAETENFDFFEQEQIIHGESTPAEIIAEREKPQKVCRCKTDENCIHKEFKPKIISLKQKGEELR